jgi:hypothetical protein
MHHSKTILRSLWVSFAAIGITAMMASAQVKTPHFAEMTTCFPAGGKAGTTVTVHLFGKALENPGGILVEGDGVTVKSLKSISTAQVDAELAIDANAEPGIRGVRVTGSAGTTDPAWFVVGDIPEVLEQEPNDTPKLAKPVSLPAVINARLNPAEDIDICQFAARKGEKVNLSVACYTLDSQIMPGYRYADCTLTVYSAKGQQLASNEDYSTLDPALAFTAPEDGSYFAEVREMGYQGGENAVYRLTVGDLPIPVAVYPGGARRGESANVEVVGLGVDAGTRATLTAPKETPLCYVWKQALVGSGAAVPFLIGDLPEALEGEPNDMAAQATPASYPLTMNGRLGSPGDVDMFALDLKARQEIAVDVLAGRILRSPVDLSVSILSPSGIELAQNDDDPSLLEPTANRADVLSGDPRLEFTAPSDGRYTLVIRDLAGRGGPECIYRATITAREPGFKITTWYDNPVVRGPGGVGVVTARITRTNGFTGAVKARLTGLPPGWTGSEAWFAAPAGNYNNFCVLTMRAPADAPVGATVTFGIEGEAKIGEKLVTVRCEPRSHMGQNSDHSMFRLTPRCYATVVPVDELRVSTETRSITGKAGDTIPIPVRLSREPGFNGDFSLWPLRGGSLDFGPPVTVAKGAETWSFPLTVPKNMAPGDYSFVLCRPIYGDLRVDRPHTSTEVLTLKVLANEK